MAWSAAAKAVDCPRKGTLGTSRVLEVDAATTPRVGLKSFPQTLPLGDHEVVLTFDDGPWPPTTPRVLAALARECVRATFFLIGKPASEHPGLVRRIAAEGHTIGHHTWLHRSLMQIPADQTSTKSIGVSPPMKWRFTVSRPGHRARRSFVFPASRRQPATLELLQSRGIVVFGTDLWASDWNPMTPKQELKLIIDRLNIARKGIILFHDPKAQTAAMLPAFLHYLRDHHFRVVHVVPAAAGVHFDGVP